MDKQAIIKALRDTAQSASNAIASNVSGPVDLLAAGLRMGGLNVNNPVGGSQWMAEKGLTREVEAGVPRIVGETLGMAGPTLAANFAPKIAGALNQGAANLAAPRTMNPQTGAIVWHGSPHKFNKFDSSKIGTGEGAQAYGHGLYLAESRDVASGYRNKLNDSPIASVKADRYDIAGDPHWIIKSYDSNGKLVPKESGYLTPDEVRQHYGDEIADKVFATEYGGHLEGLNVQDGALYKVDLPDEHIAKMLDWDKPLSQQHPDVQSVLLNHPDVIDQIQKAEAQRVLLNERSPMQLDKIPSASIPYDASRMAGKDALTAIKQRSGLGVTGGVEQQLRQAGIPGIRYLDGGSRDAGAGTSNFVVFPGNEGILKILERNGQPLGLMGIR